MPGQQQAAQPPDVNQAYLDAIARTNAINQQLADTYQREIEAYRQSVTPAAPAPTPAANGKVSWYTMFRADNYIAGLGSVAFNILTKGFTGWLKGDPFAAIAASFNIASVLTKTNFSNAAKGAKNLVAGVAITALVVPIAYLLFKSWWQPAHQKKATTTVSSTAPLSPTQASEAQADLAASVERTSTGLQKLGMNKADVQQAAAFTRLTEGSRIAERAHPYSGPVIVSPNGPIQVISRRTPSTYLAPTEADLGLYLTSLSRPKATQRDLITNSAAIHGATVVENR